ncbi:MAG: BMP family ABC transporter substrate-binding protein [Clostridiales bacterium]|nr:BMP family ABC transporter substrate-binding protein [Clostridiales bacterium]
MKAGMKRVYGITLISAVAMIIIAFAIHHVTDVKEEKRTIRVGFVYVGDASDAYTANFLKAQSAMEKQYGGQVEVTTMYNVPENDVQNAFQELVEDHCDLIFSTSYGYGEAAKKIAVSNPEIQVCQATCSNANEEPYVSNYHTFMGNIYQGRYISGVVAGMKLKELIDSGAIKPDQAKVGYVGAYPYAEVISGYTSFLLGIRWVVPEATMTVKYTNTWSDYYLEKKCAEELIDEGCVIISQHSDTSGPATACEETDRSQIVYYVSYNQSMGDVAPTTYLTGSKINWTPYVTKAVQAVLSNKEIEKNIKGNVNGNDVGAGFDCDWVQMLELNQFVAAKGTQERVDELVRDFQQNKVQVFKGDYIGVDPEDASDTIDLRDGYPENEKASAPSFHYVLKDVITIEEFFGAE